MKERVSKVQNREKRNLSSPLSWLWVSSLLCFFFSDVRSSEPSFVLSSCDLGKEKSTTFQNRHQIWDLTISIWLEWAALRCAVLRACLCLCLCLCASAGETLRNPKIGKRSEEKRRRSFFYGEEKKKVSAFTLGRTSLFLCEQKVFSMLTNSAKLRWFNSSVFVSVTQINVHTYFEESRFNSISGSLSRWFQQIRIPIQNHSFHGLLGLFFRNHLTCKMSGRFGLH